MAKVNYADEVIEDDEMRGILTDLARRASDPYSAREWRRILRMLTKIGSPTKKLLDALERYVPLGTSYPVSFDYDHIVEEAMRSEHYGEQRLDLLLKRFPRTRGGIHEANLMLFRPWQPCETKELTALFRERNLHPADIYESIALLKRYPWLQNQLPIAALGSATPWASSESNDDLCVPILISPYNILHLEIAPHRLRRLEPYHDAGLWSDEFCFAVVRKEQKP